MANTIQIKRSSVAGKVPLATDLNTGELAINLADKKIFTRDAAGTIIELGAGSGGGGGITTGKAIAMALVFGG